MPKREQERYSLAVPTSGDMYPLTGPMTLKRLESVIGLGQAVKLIEVPSKCGTSLVISEAETGLKNETASALTGGRVVYGNAVILHPVDVRRLMKKLMVVKAV